MMPHVPTVLETIGNTPLIRIQRLNPNNNVQILAKLEFMNPSGSIKDRIVSHIIEDAEAKGLLRPGGTIVENTSGNTGAAVAMVAAIKGYRAILTMPDKVSKEKQNMLRALGAEIIVCPTKAAPGAPTHYVQKALDLARSTPNSFRINQYDNAKNAEAHYLTTGPEIWAQASGNVDYFLASGSTGGTVSGAGRYLKEKNPHLKIIMPDPVGSIYYKFFRMGAIDPTEIGVYNVEGVGEDHLAKCMDFSVVDEMVQFTDKDAFYTARLLATREGIFAGGSSGANLWAALELAKTLTKPATIVTVFPDTGLKYLSKMFDDEWMQVNGFTLEDRAEIAA
ncbi:MAG TPA: cysteine synthase family protein [Sulfuriferula sp.]|nr:cysteine synthase family protein [Sulfuriferula sp.]